MNSVGPSTSIPVEQGLGNSVLSGGLRLGEEGCEVREPLGRRLLGGSEQDLDPRSAKPDSQHSLAVALPVAEMRADLQLDERPGGLIFQ
jgi:hypothetical protein